MPIKSTFCKAGVFRLSVLSAALAVALPSFAATIEAVDPTNYPYIIQGGTTSIDDSQITVSGADVTLANGTVVQKQGVVARSNSSDRAIMNLGNAETQSVQINVDSRASTTAY